MSSADVEVGLTNCMNFCCLIPLCAKCIYTDSCSVPLTLIAPSIVREKNEAPSIRFTVLSCSTFAMSLTKALPALSFRYVCPTSKPLAFSNSHNQT